MRAARQALPQNVVAPRIARRERFRDLLPPHRVGQEPVLNGHLLAPARIPDTPPATTLRTFRDYLCHMRDGQVEAAIMWYFGLAVLDRTEGFFQAEVEHAFIHIGEVRFCFALWLAFQNRENNNVRVPSVRVLMGSWQIFSDPPFANAVRDIFELERASPDHVGARLQYIINICIGN
jgi:hypothetical protein